MADSEIHFGLLLILAGKCSFSPIFYVWRFFSTPLKCIPQLYYIMYVMYAKLSHHTSLITRDSKFDPPKLPPLSFNFTWSLFFFKFWCLPNAHVHYTQFCHPKEEDLSHGWHLYTYVVRSSSLFVLFPHPFLDLHYLLHSKVYGLPRILKRKASLAILVMLACTLCNPSSCKFPLGMQQHENKSWISKWNF